MDALNKLLGQLGISKVKLAKYLGVSRQMVYNYLTLDSIEKWPNEKKVLLFQLLDIPDGKADTIKKIDVSTEYILGVEKRINVSEEGKDRKEDLSLSGLNDEEKSLLNDSFRIIKELLSDGGSNIGLIKYLNYTLQSVNNIPEIKYFLAYIAKSNGFIDPEEFIFDENKQFIFEGIEYSGLSLYNNGGASKSKVAESRRRFTQDIEAKKEDKLSRTQALTTVKIQALHELGYDDINESNAAEVFEKIAEIQSRKV